MIPTLVLPLITEVLRLVNNIIEGKPMEQRRAEALIAFQVTKPLIYPLLTEEARQQVDQLMKGVLPK